MNFPDDDADLDDLVADYANMSVEVPLATLYSQANQYGALGNQFFNTNYVQAHTYYTTAANLLAKALQRERNEITRSQATEHYQVYAENARRCEHLIQQQRLQMSQTTVVNQTEWPVIPNGPPSSNPPNQQTTRKSSQTRKKSGHIDLTPLPKPKKSGHIDLTPLPKTKKSDPGQRNSKSKPKKIPKKVPKKAKSSSTLHLSDTPSVTPKLPDVPDKDLSEAMHFQYYESEVQAIGDIISEAMEHDRSGRKGDAIELYQDAAHQYIEIIRRDDIAPDQKLKLQKVCSDCLKHIETLNDAERGDMKVEETLTADEKKVLALTSTIGNFIYLPWADVDLREKFACGGYWKDKDGLLPLSPKQIPAFGGWRRLRDIATKKPRIIKKICGDSVTQTLITDCSFVSSIIITAEYERRFKKQLITNILYPQRHGVPVYNPDGKYMVKLFLNGVYRKVLIDDLLPVDRGGDLLCSFSTDPNEFWVSLIEKAFLKVMGGYDFPGSTSCHDLHVLTGWIPERIGLKDIKGGDTALKKRTFERVQSGLTQFGDALVTVATGQLDEDIAEEVGLVPTHAYAVLKCVEVYGVRLFQLKNPWAHKRWKGAYSADDISSGRWTPQLMQALNYNIMREVAQDNGIFWISYDDLLNFFSAIFLNWNPELLKYKMSQHFFWDRNVGPDNDSVFLHENPQFLLNVKVPTTKDDPEILWILLQKHLTTSKEIEQKKNDFLTLHVYENVPTLDMKVYYRGKPIHQGVYINSPHYLVRLEIPQGERKYTIVVSQYKKKYDISFTMTCYCGSPVGLFPIKERYQHIQTADDGWKEGTCGGCPNYQTFHKNPQYRVTIKQKTSIILYLLAPKKLSINALLIQDDAEKIMGSMFAKDQVFADSGAYRPGFVFVEAQNLNPGKYVIILSTFEQNEQGNFRLTVKSTKTKFELKKIEI